MDEKKFSVHIEMDVSLTQQDIDDIMVTALEGGINYWCGSAKVVEEKRCSEWGHEQIARGGALILHDAESSDKWELNLEKFLTGVKLWLQNNEDRYGAVASDGTLDPGEVDAEMADLIVQYALFGKPVFG
ncbi:hypothetical protein [Faecalibaculum rodentium]|jgi:hypothetical protein|uniref:hypothetical protein n=1 Tax=Faecalibaculum rodentium TaxID=1702221 RepID=UPI0026F3CCBB|nr:hypothetical protein [Faecalibaculum rodentium]